MQTFFGVFYQVFRRDLLLAYRRLNDTLNAVLFFLIIVMMFPMAVTPDIHQLQIIAPGIIWIGALLANLLTFDRLFRDDYEDGSLQLFLLSPHPLSLITSAKAAAHWLSSNLPLILMTPFLGIALHLTFNEINLILISLILGTPIFSLLGSVIAALTVGLNNQGVLLAILLLPLLIPVVILGVSSVLMHAAGLSSTPGLALLTAFTIITFILSPIATAAILRN